MTDLRRRLRKANVEYVVIKNTLALRAVNESGLVGRTVARSDGPGRGEGCGGGCQGLTDFAKENDQRPAVKGGLFDGKQIDKAQIKKLASMPSREQMLAQLAAGLQSPLAGFLGALSGVMYTFVGALEGLKAQREGATDGARQGPESRSVDRHL